jgi:hypothetical protein
VGHDEKQYQWSRLLFIHVCCTYKDNSGFQPPLMPRCSESKILRKPLTQTSLPFYATIITFQLLPQMSDSSFEYDAGPFDRSRPYIWQYIGSNILHYAPSFYTTLRERKSNMKANMSKPLPTKRKRALTLLSPASPKQSTVPQTQSPLFSKLPFEIRSLIYGHMLRGVVHVFRLDKKLLAWRCGKQSRGENMQCHWSHPCWYSSNGQGPQRIAQDFPGNGIPFRQQVLLELLCSCRLV